MLTSFSVHGCKQTSGWRGYDVKNAVVHLTLLLAPSEFMWH
uniref:Uncharacterized protein n=1 Tax=Arundo donax TaxID=35708 RepID=A0A0A8XYH4_ARUDO